MWTANAGTTIERRDIPSQVIDLRSGQTINAIDFSAPFFSAAGATRQRIDFSSGGTTRQINLP